VWVALPPAYCQELSGLKGLVADEATNSVADADVQLKHHKSPAAFKKVLTARDGTFQFGDIPAGRDDVLVMSPGFPSILRLGLRVRPGEMLRLGAFTVRYVPTPCAPPFSYLPEIENTRSGASQIDGSVGNESGQPLTDAVVVAKAPARITGHVKTDSQGRFILESLPEGAYTLRVSLPGYSDFLVDLVPVKSGEETRIHRLLMQRCRAGCRRKPIKYNQVAVACQ
jgi:hypothetical protein